MSNCGVTDDGFVLKPIDQIFAEARDRAVAAFGSDVDLTSTSALRKILEVTAAEDAELWKRMEDLYYSGFVSTAYRDALDLLGAELGLARPYLASTGTVTVTLAGAAPARRYVLPEGTILLSGAPVQAFGTVHAAYLDAQHTTSDLDVVAFEPGPAGNLPAGAIQAIDPAYQAIYLADLGAASFTVRNAQPTTGGDRTEGDETYRARLLGLARNLWTLDAVRQAVLGLTGVSDVLLSDPLGGVDVSQSYFNMFAFDQRLFSGEPRVGEAYFFDVVVAHEFRAPWRTTGAVPGIYERVAGAIDRVRPVGIHPNIVEADHIDVGMRAVVTVEAGSDGGALLASIRQRLSADIGELRLGGDLLYSQVVRAFVEQPGVVDVQGLHLRRNPPAFGRITFGPVPHQSMVIEAGVGENLKMGPTEMAVFPAGGETLDIRLVTR